MHPCTRAQTKEVPRLYREEKCVCGEEWESVICEREAKIWRGKEGDSARARAVGADVASVEDGTDKVEVLVFIMDACRSCCGDGHRG